jgi:gas vesicle protein
MSDENSNQVGGMLTAFAVGALVGAGIALLYAPQSGKKTRDLLARRANELRDKAGEALDESKEMVRGKKAQVLAAVEAGREAMENEGGKQRKAA